MRIGLDVSQQQLEWPEIARRAKLADDLGFDGIWLFDHFKTMYGESGGPCFEAWTSLAALAAITERARLGILITGMTYRHPSVLASEAVTVDHVSGGRLELSLGAAWFEEEHRELGIEFPPTGERVSRFEEYVQVVHLLLTEDDVSFDGRWHHLDRATYRPRPVQRPHPPIWIGANGPRMLAIAGRHANVWHTYAPAPDHVRMWSTVAGAAEAAGRDPSSITRASNLSLSEPWDEVRANAAAYRDDAGVGYLVASWPSEGVPRVEEFATKVMPELTAG